MRGSGIGRGAWPALVLALVVASCSSPSATSSSSPRPSASASAPLVAAPSGSPAAVASPGGAASISGGGSSASPSAVASPSSGGASASPNGGASASPGSGVASPAAAGSGGACTPAATALAAEKAKITDAYDRDYAQAEAFRSQQAGSGSMVDDVEAKLASARDSGVAAVTSDAGTACLDAQALAALDAATATQVSAIDAVMPQSGSPSGSGTSGGYALAGGDGVSSAQGLPPCSGMALLDHVPTSDVASIEPLGHMYGEHIVPVQADHIYLQPSPTGPAVTVYAPGNVTLLQVVAQTHTSGGDVGLGTDYTVKFSSCSSVMFGFIHLRTLSDPIKATLSGVTPACSGGALASNCVYGGLSIKLASGDPIGTGLGTGYALDFGAADIRTPTLAFIHQTDMGGMLGDSYAHAVCPLDYFTAAVKSQLYAKLETKNAGANGIPACGAVMQDKPGTSQGNWYSSPVSTFGQGLVHLLAMAHEDVDPSQAIVSAGTDLLPSTDFGAQIVYTPRASGVVDPDPGRITSDGHVYCIQGQLSVGQQNGHVDVEMVDAGTLKADYAAGSCAATPALSANAVTYQR